MDSTSGVWWGWLHTPTAASFIPAIKKDKKANASLAMLPLGRHHRCTPLVTFAGPCPVSGASGIAWLSGSEEAVFLSPPRDGGVASRFSGSAGADLGMTASVFSLSAAGWAVARASSWAIAGVVLLSSSQTSPACSRIGSGYQIGDGSPAESAGTVPALEDAFSIRTAQYARTLSQTDCAAEMVRTAAQDLQSRVLPRPGGTSWPPPVGVSTPAGAKWGPVFGPQ